MIGGLINAYFVGKKEASDIHCNGVLPILDKKNMPSSKFHISAFSFLFVNAERLGAFIRARKDYFLNIFFYLKILLTYHKQYSIYREGFDLSEPNEKH